MTALKFRRLRNGVLERRPLTAVEAAEAKQPGDRFQSPDGTWFRVHRQLVEGWFAPHFEIEPRWN